MRHRQKNGVEDLEKAKWYLEKLIKKEKYQELDEIEKKVGGTI